MLTPAADIAAVRARIEALVADGVAPDAVRPRIDERRLTAGEVAAGAGVDVATIARLRVASGLPDPGADAAYSTADVAAARSFASIALLFGDDVALQFARVTGAALARIAEAAVAAYAVNVHAPLEASGANDAALADAAGRANAMIPDVVRLMDSQLRHLVSAASEQFAAARPAGSGATPDTVALTIGFVDLVDSTAWSQRIEPDRLAGALAEFAVIAGDIVSRRGARLVKLIGDGAMFVAPDARDACDVALDLLEACEASDALPPARVGLARGEVVTRDGEYHGAVVALASRIANQAAPSSVLVPETLASELGLGAVGLAVVPRGRRRLRGFDDPLGLVELRRCAPAPRP